jgi:membrane protease subunit HflK
VLEEYQKAPDVTRQRIYLETMERLFAGTDKIIIDAGVGGAGQAGVLPILPLNELMQRRPAASPAPQTSQQSIPSSTVREVPRGGNQ